MKARGLLVALAIAAALTATARAGSDPRRYDGTYQLRAPLIPAHLSVNCTGAPAQSIPIPAHARRIHVLNGMLDGRRIDQFGDISYLSQNSIGGASVLVHSKWKFSTLFHSVTYAFQVHAKSTFKSVTCLISGGYFQTGRRIGS